MSHFQPILADMDDIIKVLFATVVPIIWILSQVLGGKEKQGQGGKRLQKRPQAAPPKAQQEELSDEIEKFLRRATARRGQQQAAAVEVIEPGQGAPQTVVLDASSARKRARGKPKAAPPRLGQTGPAQTQPVDVLRSSEGVAQHVQEHIGGSAFSEQVSRLGEEVGLADDKLESRLHKKFDHHVGRLERIGAPLSAPAPTLSDAEHPVEVAALTSAQGIRKLFQSPEGVRQAIILSEVLQRPEHRW